VGDCGRVEVLRDREQESGVDGQLRDSAFRLLVQLVVPGQLGEERLEPALLREGGHAEEQFAGILVLRDRLEPFDVVMREFEHHRDNERPRPAVTA
jgi:hypothetical protein